MLFLAWVGTNYRYGFMIENNIATTQQYSTQTHRRDSLVCESRQSITRHTDFHLLGIKLFEYLQDNLLKRSLCNLDRGLKYQLFKGTSR